MDYCWLYSSLCGERLIKAATIFVIHYLNKYLCRILLSVRFRPAVSPSIPRPTWITVQTYIQPLHFTYVCIHIRIFRIQLFAYTSTHFLRSDDVCRIASALATWKVSRAPAPLHHWHGISISTWHGMAWVAMCVQVSARELALSAGIYFCSNLQELAPLYSC